MAYRGIIVETFHVRGPGCSVGHGLTSPLFAAFSDTAAADGPPEQGTDEAEIEDDIEDIAMGFDDNVERDIETLSMSLDDEPQDTFATAAEEHVVPEMSEEEKTINMMIDQDLTDMGLCLDSLRVIRYSGHRTSLSGLYATIAHDFEFYCNGERFMDQMAGEPFYDMYLSRYETPAGRMWGTNTVWWADYASAHPTVYLSTVLERGKYALLGGHPICMWYGGNPDAYWRLDSICTSLEQDYGYFGWLLPIEYGRFLEDTYRIEVTGMRTGQDFIELDFSG